MVVLIMTVAVNGIISGFVSFCYTSFIVVTSSWFTKTAISHLAAVGFQICMTLSSIAV